MNILVDAEWMEHPEIKALVEKGHQVMYTPPVDLILSKTAWNWSEHHWKYLDVALKEIRKVNRLKPKEAKHDFDPTGRPNKSRRSHSVAAGANSVKPRKPRKVRASKPVSAAFHDESTNGTANG
jgi:hypothetical protein